MTSWAYCSCSIKSDVLKLIIMTKKNLLAGKIVPKFTTLELALISGLAFTGTMFFVFFAICCYKLQFPKIPEKVSDHSIPINEIPQEKRAATSWDDDE